MSTRVPAPSADDSPRDAALSRAYRDAVQAQGASGEPPAALDDAIRAAARRSVHAGPRDAAHAARGGWFGQRWQTPVALAASMVLAVGVAIKVYDTGEADVRPAEPPVPTASTSASVPAPNASSSAAAPPPEPTQAPAPVDAAADANANAVGQAGGSMQSTPAPIPSAPTSSTAAPSPAPARPVPPARESRVETDPRGTTRDAEMLRQDRAQRSEGPADAQSGPASATPAESRAGIIARGESAAGAASSESKPFPAERARESTSAEPPPAGGPKPSTAPQGAANTATPPAAPAARSAAAPAAPPAPDASPAPAAAATPASSEKSTGQSALADRVLRERSAMKVEQAQAATKPGVGAGLAGRIEGRMQSGAGPAAAPRPLIASAQELQSRPAEDWIASIRELRRAERTNEADELLAAFRKQFPDFTLPDDLR